jgi:Flp pilus assembly protein TadD
MPQSSTESFPGIFISYRRNDCPGHAGRLNDKLVEHFGYDQVFMDVDGIGPGEDFIEVIERELDSCAILLAMIGCDWLTGSSDKNLLQNANDYVRLEIATALRRNIRVVPILVEGAEMPKLEDLPDDMAKLLRRNAVPLSDLRWSRDVAELIASLEPIVKKPADEADPKTQFTPALTTLRSRSRKATMFPLGRLGKVVRTLFIVAAAIALIGLVALGVSVLRTEWRHRAEMSGDNNPPASSPSVTPPDLEVDEQVSRARELSRLKNFVEAEPHWRAAVARDRFNAEYNNGLGVALYFQKKYSEAEPFFRQAAAVNPGNAQYNADLGNALSSQAKYAEAERSHREAVRLSPNIHFIDALAIDLFFQGNCVEAEKWFRKALSINPDDAEIQNSLGNAVYCQKNYAEAKAHYGKALQLQPGNPIFKANVRKTEAFTVLQ